MGFCGVQNTNFNNPFLAKNKTIKNQYIVKALKKGFLNLKLPFIVFINDVYSMKDSALQLGKLS